MVCVTTALTALRVDASCGTACRTSPSLVGVSKEGMAAVLIQIGRCAGYPVALSAISIAGEVGVEPRGGPVDNVAVVRTAA